MKRKPTSNLSRFADMKDDLPFAKPVRVIDRRISGMPIDTPGYVESLERQILNLKKNRNRKPVKQRGRMKLLMCSHCTWRVRAAQSTIDRAINAPCPACVKEGGAGVLIQGD